MTKIYNFLQKGILLLALCFISTSIFAQTIFVNLNATGANDGSNWTDAYTDLKTALDNATTGQSLWVAMGIYNPHPSDRTVFFEIKEGVQVYGGFLGNEANLDDRDYISYPTILSGDIDGDNDLSSNSFTVIYTEDVTSATIVDGIIIEGGSANDGASIYTAHKKAGGWYNRSITSGTVANPIIRNCIFRDNYADKFAGALYNHAQSDSEASPIIINCLFENNESDERGGAITNDGDSSPKIIKTTFLNNNSTEGGAIYNNGHGNIVKPIIINTIFTGNFAPNSNHGGAIYNFGKSGGEASPTITNSVFNLNHAGHGGAIYGIAIDFGIVTPKIINSTFYKNFADQNAGAVYASESSYGNNQVSIYNSIFWDNDNGSTGGPVFHFSGTETPVIELNSVLVDTTNCALLHHSSTGQVSCNGNMLYELDPTFEDAANGDFRLKQNSAAINMGNDIHMNIDLCDIDGDANISEQIDLDLDLNGRFDGTIDLGPYEKVGGLPIELLSFDVRFDGKKVELNWVTLSEMNNDYFSIERSTNGVDFREIAQEQGAGTSEMARTYLNYDENPQTGINYYRLKQIDFDGSYAYSDIQSVEVRSGVEVSTFPNPVATQLNISLTDFEERTIDFEVYHISGKKVFEGTADVNEGLVVVSLDNINNLQPGQYIVRITNTNEGDLYGNFVKVRL